MEETTIEKKPGGVTGKAREKTRVHIPQIADLATAIRIYYSRLELNNADIKELFPSACAGTVLKLKKKAQELMMENNVMPRGTYSVETKVAYRAWGFDIADLEKRHEKLKKLNMTG